MNENESKAMNESKASIWVSQAKDFLIRNKDDDRVFQVYMECVSSSDGDDIELYEFFEECDSCEVTAWTEFMNMINTPTPGF